MALDYPREVDKKGSSFVISSKFAIFKIIKNYWKFTKSKVYEGTCSYDKTYIGETKRNASVRWEEHNNPTKNSEPAKHLKNNTDHVFNCVILCMASKNYKVRRNLGASYIALLRPTLNEQKDFEILTLFRNGVTWVPKPI